MDGYVVAKISPAIANDSIVGDVNCALLSDAG